MKQLSQRPRVALFTMPVAVIMCLCAASTVQAAGRNLSVVVNPAGAGITIVDQITGAVTQCAIKANFPNNIATCVKIGKATPNTVVPTPPVGLSLYLEQQTSTSGSVQPVPGIWLVNNSTGDITYCNAIDSGGTPAGSCADLGIVSQ